MKELLLLFFVRFQRGRRCNSIFGCSLRRWTLAYLLQLFIRPRCALHGPLMVASGYKRGSALAWKSQKLAAIACTIFRFCLSPENTPGRKFAISVLLNRTWVLGTTGHLDGLATLIPASRKIRTLHWSVATDRSEALLQSTNLLHITLTTKRWKLINTTEGPILSATGKAFLQIFFSVFSVHSWSRRPFPLRKICFSSPDNQLQSIEKVGISQMLMWSERIGSSSQIPCTNDWRQRDFRFYTRQKVRNQISEQRALKLHFSRAMHLISPVNFPFTCLGNPPWKSIRLA